MIEPGILAELRRDHDRRGLLRTTYEKRRICVEALSRWLGDRTLWSVTPDELNRFLDARKICARSRYTWLANLHVFYTWAIEAGHTDTDPTAKIVRPRLRRALPRPCSTADLRTALAAAGPRMRCWLLLAAYQGLRCQEIAGLRREDVIVADGLLRVVHAKGGHERLLPLHPEVEAAVIAAPRLKSGWLFERPHGGPYTPNQVSNLIAEYSRDVGLPVTAHQLRHWFGTNLYAKTHDLRLVQEMMGHATPQTTAVYTKFDNVAARSAVAALDVHERGGLAA